MVRQRKVILLEINEITWTLIDPLIAAGKLPTFDFLKKNGTWASPMSVDLAPHLDPWITWTTVYTGRTQDEHNVYFLQQEPETIKAKRIWEILAERNVPLGIYGSVCSWPPKPVKGFHVPDTFSPDFQTHPANLASIQQLNLTYTRSVRLPQDQDNFLFKLKLGLKLLGLGFSFSTAMAIAKQLMIERFKPKLRWQRVMLQPLINFDFFSQHYQN